MIQSLLIKGMKPVKLAWRESNAITHSHARSRPHGKADSLRLRTYQMTSMLGVCTFQHWISGEPCDE